MKKIIRYFSTIVLVGALGGCATHSRTVTSETRDGSDAVVETRTETTETRSESGGVLSSTVDVVGDVISLPFRAVGALVRGIF
jgi:hypothetical protein